MAQNTQETRYQLARRELLALERARGNLLTCASGEIWITVHGSQEDIILKAGESWKVRDGGAVVASALQDSVLVVAHPQAMALRIALHQAGASILLLLRRWKHPSLASYSSILVR
jgi:hypothetical protein